MSRCVDVPICTSLAEAFLNLNIASLQINLLLYGPKNKLTALSTQIK
ncbi:MAG: hypothetical protein PHY63_05640 [Candidatus Cloacimonetes bacterium]|nr:hypothetical protein [Candidatus Cloacimonadota bacterium]